MTKLKTTANQQSPLDFINSLDNQTRREDSLKLLKIFEKTTKQPSVMWVTAIIGYGSYHYVYESGREGHWMKTGFSPRRNYISVYLMFGIAHFDELLAKLGKYKQGKSCLNIYKLSDVDLSILEELIRESYRSMCEKYD
jgi:hypothetical protein